MDSLDKSKLRKCERIIKIQDDDSRTKNNKILLNEVGIKVKICFQGPLSNPNASSQEREKKKDR